MLPLTASILDTLKILMIANSLTYYNHMPDTFSEMMNRNGYHVMVDSLFMAGGSPECILIRSIYPEVKYCSEDEISTHPVWKTSDHKHKEFVKKISGYDIIYLQNGNYVDPKFLDLINGVDDKTNSQVIIFQNYKSITWSDAVRRSELDNDRAYFDSQHFSEQVVLMPVGTLFDLLLQSDPDLKLLDNTSHPTAYGSQLIAELLASTILESTQN